MTRLDKKALRFKVPASVLHTMAIFFFCTAAAHGQITRNVFMRVLLIQVGNTAGTGFTVDVDGRQYVVTAKHVISAVKDDDAIRLHRYDGWTSARVKVFRCDDPIDIAVLIPDKQVTVNLPLEPTMAGMQVGQDTYFLGFPFGELFSDIQDEKVGDHVSLPFFRKAIISGSVKVGDGGRIYLDGHNNPGFSGGPIVFHDFNQNGYVMKVAGVISGYRPDLKNVLEPRKIKPDEDLSRGRRGVFTQETLPAKMS
jgi:hypothetical protein